ncbi:hypothetical protein POM88_042896 [Heracleum sosnowskyi]|uniref:PABC domain-containing protein n=1 Tax=Heracleum sosnowskyi TaxID=360622 RepID=A0AAD8M9M2_9APIA|nr:hypothetical protein POM88_042896 [Heracleum sosnowskyi]
MQDHNEKEKSSMKPFDIEVESTEQQITDVEEPHIGMIFYSYEDLLRYYERYAKQKGFAVVLRTTSKSDDGEKIYKTITCCRGGQRALRSKNEFKSKPTAGTNCKARLNIIIGPDTRCVLNSLVLEHNHSLSPNKTRYFRLNRSLNPHVKRKLELNDIAGIRANKSYRSLVVEAGGPENVPFLEKDCRIFLDKVRRLRLGEGDAMAINAYFLKMQADNAKFFYVMDLDEKGRLKNVFWADARSRAAYEEFNNVITFDTTYLTNNIYTNSKFKEFQLEVKGKIYCEVSLNQTDGSKYEDSTIDKIKNVAGNMARHGTGPPQQNRQHIPLLQTVPADEQTMVENLYLLVKKLEHDQATEVTNMLLKMDKAEVLHILESPDLLKAKVLEAVEVLEKGSQDIAVD